MGRCARQSVERGKPVARSVQRHREDSGCCNGVPGGAFCQLPGRSPFVINWRLRQYFTSGGTTMTSTASSRSVLVTPLCHRIAMLPLLIDSAPIITAVVPEPGTPRVSIGINDPQAEALFAASAAPPREYRLYQSTTELFLSHIGDGAGNGRSRTWQDTNKETDHR